MDGLDASEICISDLREENPNFRIDAIFFGKKVLNALAIVNKNKCFYLKAENIVNGPFGSTITIDSHLENGYIPLVRSTNINRGFFINKTDLVYISEDDNNIIKHSQLNKDDIVLSRVGSIGFFARVDDDMGTCNISSNNIGIKLGNFLTIEKHYILTYLNTEFAYELTNRRASGNVQPKLTVSEICRIPIPSFSTGFYKLISSLVLKSELVRKQSFETYSSAESALLSSLGIADFAPSESIASVKSLSESFATTGRLDAEYYQSKYDEYLFLLHKFEFTSIPAEYDVFRNSGTDYADGVTAIGVIKTKQLSNSGIDIDGVESYFDAETCAENKCTFLMNGDVVFASMGVGSLGKISQFVYKGNKQYVTDSTLRIYRKKSTSRVLPEVLCVFLQSKIGQELIYRYIVGSTGIINIYDSDMARIPIPILDRDMQSKIASKVQQSFDFRQKSEQFLENAKLAVEIAIEQSEEKAIQFLNGKV